MKKVSLKFVSAVFFLVCVFTSAFYAQTRIISPVSGTWANRQSLVLDVNDGAECFYSFSGSDPLTSGFAYDGPVLIDSAGDVNVRIAVVVDDECKERLEVSYVVNESDPFAEGSSEYDFIHDVVSEGVFMYSYDNPLSIPSSLSYSFGYGEKPFLSGKELSLDPSNRLARYIPCTVTDGSCFWRFLVLTGGGDIGILSKYTVPFEIQDWNTFVFTGEKLIWSIDDGEWSASSVPVELDRSVKHKINWQSVAYESGNPVQSFVLPAKPELIVEKENGGAVSFSISGDTRYRMGILSSGLDGEAFSNGGLLSQAVFDTFEGDSISGTAEFAFYCDGVYMGTESASYSVDRQPPLAPVFISDAESSYARSSVSLSVESEADSEVFYAVSSAVVVDDDNSGADSAEFDYVEAGNFSSYNGAFTLESGREAALFYKVRAYAVDSAGNMSSVSEYRVIIDEFNYYIAENADENADGSRQRPFYSFEQALEVMAKSRFAHFFVSGTVRLPSGETVLSSNCSFTAVDNNGRFVIPSDGSIVVRSSSLTAENMIFEKERASGKNSLSVFFTLENAAVSFDNCEIFGQFEESGTVFNSMNSVVSLTDSGVTVQSDSYACALSSSDSKISVSGSRVSSVAQTAVNFSVQGGQFELKESECRVVSHLGRIAELMRTNATLTSNKYTGEFDRKVKGIVPVWNDKESLILDDSSNVSEGF